MALAALLHVDAHGTPVVAAMVERSGLAPKAWLERFLCDQPLPELLDGYADRPERPHAATHGSVANPLVEAAELVPAPVA
jgi:siderophore synthetase component